MYQRPRKLADFDLRVARAFSFIVGAILVAYGYWGLRWGDDGNIATAILRITLILAGICCLYVAAFNRVKALKDVEPDGNTDPLLGLLMLVIFFLSFLVALVLPEQSNRKS